MADLSAIVYPDQDACVTFLASGFFVKTVLGIGAHYDDCVFGIPGILLKAVRKNYRVVVLSLIGDYSNWKPVRGRERELVEGTVLLGREHGVEMRFLPFAEMKIEPTLANQRLVAEAVADIAPDIIFHLWPHDRHPDHEAAAALCQVAVGYGDRVLPPDRAYRRPTRIYHFDNGPRHTLGFEPDTFIDISDEWPQARDWLGKLMALMRNMPFDPVKLDAAVQAKQTLAQYRGQSCGVSFAEAVRGLNAYPAEVL